MQKQRNKSQMKKQEKCPEKELNEMEASKLPGTEFKTVVLRMFKELSDNFNSLKKDQSEIKYTLTEMKNNLQGIHSGVDKAENQISNLEYKQPEIPSQNSKRKKNPKEWT